MQLGNFRLVACDLVAPIFEYNKTITIYSLICLSCIDLDNMGTYSFTKYNNFSLKGPIHYRGWTVRTDYRAAPQS